MWWGAVLHFCTEHRDVEQEDQEFRHPLLHTEFKARVGYVRPSQNTQQTNTIRNKTKAAVRVQAG